jgi:hypothetical protein
VTPRRKRKISAEKSSFLLVLVVLEFSSAFEEDVGDQHAKKGWN